MALNLDEGVGSTSPGNFGFTNNGPARASWQYYSDLADIEDNVIEILGSVSRTGSPDWKLRRILPKAHPIFPHLFASSISSMVGLGAASANNTADEELEAPTILDTFYPYPRWRLTVEFTPRNYAVLTDDNITTETLTVYDDAGASSSVTCPVEYWRFTDVIIDAVQDYATAQHGQMSFYRDDAAAPNNNTFPGHPRVFLPDCMIKFIWHAVPYSWVVHSNSKIFAYRGRVNQQTFYGWSAGSLLYESFRMVRYVPSIPERELWFGTTTFSTEKLVDVELQMRHTSRTIGSAYTPSNASHIAAGHNLEPWLFDKKFYYVGNQSATAGQRVPKFPSAVFQLMFKDPASF